ncbi:hypothetical protein TrVGV298_011576 [Trichoderma virens]|nr:hypothetical protein TrVGV298_011576 [Trichoderma virens]
MPWYLCSGGLGSSHTVTVRVQSYLTVAIFTCTVRPLDRLSSQGSPGLPKWYNDPSRLLNPPPPGRTCTRATPTPSAPAVDAQPVKSDIAALKPPPLSLYAHSRVCSPLVISSPCKTPLLDNRLSSSSHFKARTRAASPSFWETRGSQNQLSGEKKRKRENRRKREGKREENCVQKRIMKQPHLKRQSQVANSPSRHVSAYTEATDYCIRPAAVFFRHTCDYRFTRGLLRAENLLLRV